MKYTYVFATVCTHGLSNSSLIRSLVQWTPHSIRFFPIISVSAGLVAGMFGIGGGILNAPLLLELGIEPHAASALTSTTVLFSTASTFVRHSPPKVVDPNACVH